MHTAAIKSLAACERDKETALRVNLLSSEIVREYALRRRARVIYVSSDVVFDGIDGNYSERSVPKPVNWYGRTKRCCELLFESLPGAAICRTALVIGRLDARQRRMLEHEQILGSPQNQSLLPQFIQARLRQNAAVFLSSKYRSNPTAVQLLGLFLDRIIATGAEGLFHTAGPDTVSRLEMGQIIANACSEPAHLVVEEDTLDSLRPRNLGLQTEKTCSRLAVDPQQSAAEGARRIVQQLGKRCDAEAARKMLAQIGRSAVPHLADVLAEPADDLRQTLAAQALSRIGPAADAALPALEAAFRSGPVHVRAAVAEAVASIGRATPGLQTLLIDAVHGERDPSVRRYLVRAASRVFPPPIAAAVIVWSLADSEDHVNAETTAALVRLGADAVPAVMRLMEAVPDLHRNQLDGIDRLLSEHQLNYRAKKPLSREDFFVEATWKLADRHAASVLEQIGPGAATALPLLVARAGSDDPEMRHAVADALGSIAPADPAAIAALHRLAEDKKDHVRQAARRVLERCPLPKEYPAPEHPR